MNVKDAIALVNDWKETQPKIKTYVTTTELVVTFPDDREIRKSLPDDEFYVAIAPFINNTHPCETHYPSSCQGELIQETIQLKVSIENGSSLFEGTKSTMKNGFFEVWLPRNKTININIVYNSLKANEIIKTNSNRNTCITTAKLE